MHSLFEIHPIFEFLLTAYFVFLTSPKLLTEFLDFKLPNYATEDRATMQEYSSGLQTSLFLVDNLTYYYVNKARHSRFITMVSRYKERVIESQLLKDKLNDASNSEIKSRVSEEVRSCIVQTLNKNYDKIILFSILYSFIFLLINGCSWKKSHQEDDSVMLLSVSYLLVLNFIVYLVLFTRRYIKKISVKDKGTLLKKVKTYILNKKLKNYYLYIISIINIIAAILLTKYFPFGFIQMENSWKLTAIVNIAWFLNSIPIFILSFELHKNVKSAYSLTYKKEIDRLMNEIGNIEAQARELYQSSTTMNTIFSESKFAIKTNEETYSLFPVFFSNEEDAISYISNNSIVDYIILKGELFSIMPDNSSNSIPILFEKN